MFGSVLIVVLVLALGNELSERLRVKQEELILRQLPQHEAVAYYELLKRRVFKVRLVRGALLVALVVAAMAIKRIVLARSGVALDG
ncbi:MAG: hypothetical protein SF187_02795 [Deltaproteobacteria bacterium]|nr:hypothetical protein [Deltaproteobacteria bacterium]